MGNLASAVDELFALDTDALSGPGLLAEIVEVSRQRNRLDAAYLRLLERADRTGAALAESGTTQAWLREQTRISPAASHRDVHLARDLADVLPATRTALSDGEISTVHAQLIASIRPAVTDEVVARVEPHLVDYARRADPPATRRAVEHVKARYADRDNQRLDDHDDYQARAMHATTGLHGNGLGHWQLHPVGQETFMTAIHALSAPIPGDDRTPAQRRADAMVSLAEIAMRSGELPITGGVRPHVSVIVALETLEARAGAPAADYGFGATSSPDWARRIGCDAEIARIITGAASEILDAGRATRTFTAAQRRAITARDQHCIWTGCDTPAGWCDAHHITHWADGGPTSVDNGALLCGPHHDRIHLFGNAIIPDPTGYHINPQPGTDPNWKAPPKRGP